MYQITQRVRLALATATIGVILASCGGNAAPTGTHSGAANAGTTSKDTWVVGFGLSQSGNMAPFDVEPGNAALLRIEEINAAGGINGKKIEAKVKDVRSDVQTMGIVATELIGEGIDVLVTPCDFDLSAPGAIVAQAAGVPVVSICAGDPKMADKKSIGDFAFTANAGSDQEASSGASFAYEKGWRNAFLLKDLSIEYTKSAGSYFDAAFTQLGGKVVETADFPGVGTVNIASQVAAIKAKADSIDFIYVASWNPGGATAIKQIREAGITKPVVGPAALDGQLLLDIIGNANDVYYTAFACYAYCKGAGSEPLSAFEKAYQTKYNASPATSYAILGYAMMQALEKAFTEATGPGAALRDVMQAGLKVDTPMGQTTYFSSTCHKIIDFPFSVVQASGGTISFVTQQKAKLIPALNDGNACAT